MKIGFLKPAITNQDIKVMNKIIRSGWFAPGKVTEEFESKLARYLQIKHAVMTSSATAALHLSLIMAGVQEGDEVISTPLSYVATSNVILYQRAVPVFVDVNAETGLLDLNKVAAKITKKTKIILPVHLYGQMVDMKKLKKIATKHNLIIIEDAAHAIEAQRDGVRPGQLSFSAALSFHVAKNITSGQGGALVTSNGGYAQRAELLRRDGVRNVNGKRHMFELGYKYDATEFQAAMLLSQLKRIEQQHQKRNLLFQRYAKAFSGMGVDFPKIAPRTKHACHMFVVWIDPKKRDKIRKFLAKAGIDTSIHYDPIHLEPYYRKQFNYQRGDFPIAEKLGFSTITLPLYPALTMEQQGYIIKKVKGAL